MQDIQLGVGVGIQRGKPGIVRKILWISFIYFVSFHYLLYFATTSHVSRFEIFDPPRAGPRMDAQMSQLHVPRPNTLAYASAYKILNSGFLNLMTDMWGLIILCCEGLSYAL